MRKPPGCNCKCCKNNCDSVNLWVTDTIEPTTSNPRTLRIRTSDGTNPTTTLYTWEIYSSTHTDINCSLAPTYVSNYGLLGTYFTVVEDHLFILLSDGSIGKKTWPGLCHIWQKSSATLGFPDNIKYIAKVDNYLLCASNTRARLLDLSGAVIWSTSLDFSSNYAGSQIGTDGNLIIMNESTLSSPGVVSLKTYMINKSTGSITTTGIPDGSTVTGVVNGGIITYKIVENDEDDSEENRDYELYDASFNLLESAQNRDVGRQVHRHIYDNVRTVTFTDYEEGYSGWGLHNGVTFTELFNNRDDQGTVSIPNTTLSTNPLSGLNPQYNGTYVTGYHGVYRSMTMLFNRNTGSVVHGGNIRTKSGEYFMNLPMIFRFGNYYLHFSLDYNTALRSDDNYTE